MMLLDILIVADQSDLNVYRTANKDGMENSTGAGCCGNANEEVSSAFGTNDSGEKDGELANIDFNEWAGKLSTLKDITRPQLIFELGSFKIYAIKP